MIPDDTTVTRTPGSEGGRPGLPVEPRRLWLGVLDARLLLTVIVVGFAAIGLAVAKFLVPHEFDAALVLEWTPTDEADARADPTRLTTLTNTVKLPHNLAAVRAELDLPVTLEQLAAVVSVAPSARSRLITLTATAEDAQLATRMVDSLGRAFIADRKASRRSELEGRAQVLATSIQRGQQAVSEARTAYDAFRDKQGITDLEAERRVTIDRISRTSGESELAKADADAEQARASTLRHAVETIDRSIVRDEVQSSPGIAKLADARAELAKLRGRLAPDHPRVLALTAEVKSLQGSQDVLNPVQTARTVGINEQWEYVQGQITGADGSHTAARTRLDSLDTLAADARDRLEWLASLEAENDARLAKLRTAEEHLAKLSIEHALAVDAAADPDPELRVASAAREPMYPARSKRRVVALAFPLLGLALGLTWVLFTTLRGGRGWTASEVAFWSNAPVLLASGWPRQRRGLTTLADELAGAVATAPGELLVVPASAAELDSATQLVVRLVRRASKRNKGGDAVARRVQLWDGTADDGAALRRAARQASRVLVVVASGDHGAIALASLRARVGRDEGLASVVIGVGPALATCRDRMGDVDRFWGRSTTRSAFAPARHWER